MQSTNSSKITQSTYYGLGLVLLTIVVFIVLPLLTDDKIIEFASLSLYGILRLGSIFYGQTIVKLLNRNYSIWTALLFFFPAISLIILGQLDKIKNEMVTILLDPKSNSKNINDLPSLTLGTASNMYKESLMNSPFTLRHMVINYKNYIKQSTSLFPILAAFELNKQDILFDDETKNALDKFAREKGNNSFMELLDSLKAMTPEEICRTHN